MPRPRDPNPEERRKLFRWMEWAFVWGPPLLALLIAGAGGAAVAWIVPVPGTTFNQRWMAVVAVVLLPPILWQLFQWFQRRNR